MIVPSPRLLFWFATIAIPFSALGAVYPNALGISVALVCGLILVVLLDAALSISRLDGLNVTLPELLRASKDRPVTLPMLITNPGRLALTVRLGLPFPRELKAAQEEMVVRLARETETSQIEWTVTPQQRGNFRFSTVYLETPSRLGLWAIRRKASLHGEIRVYPNLIAERKNLAALFVNRGAFGLHAQRQVGKGRDFEKLREYVPGDGLDEIHWKATARRGHPVTKVFQIERTQEVYVIIDASRLSGRRILPDSKLQVSGTAAQAQVETSVLERFLTSALILGQAAEQQGDLFGLLTFTDQARTFLRAKNGKEHYAACRDAIYALEPENVTPDFDEIGSFIRTRLRRRALLIFLTSLEDPVLAESFIRNMSLLAGQHLVLVNMLKPDGADPLFTHPDVTDIDDVYRHLGGHLRWHGLRELEKVLQRRGVHFSLIENERLARELVTQYLNVKRRQLL
ncbi:MAG: DUF58 domain-containing protein [Verrucomicrobia bacterium]|nr:DUF58 domain-containing protein [Verrucomicrobiota bacterium]